MAEKEKKSSKKKSAKKSGSKIKEMYVRKAHGGFVVTHHHEPDAQGKPVPSEEHVMGPSPDELGQHVADNMSEPEDDEVAPQASPAPQGM